MQGQENDEYRAIPHIRSANDLYAIKKTLNLTLSELLKGIKAKEAYKEGEAVCVC